MNDLITGILNEYHRQIDDRTKSLKSLISHNSEYLGYVTNNEVMLTDAEKNKFILSALNNNREVIRLDASISSLALEGIQRAGGIADVECSTPKSASEFAYHISMFLFKKSAATKAAGEAAEAIFKAVP